MSPVDTFEFVLLLLVLVLALELLARRLRLPPSAALIVGGGVLAFVPGVPAFEIDSDLVLVLFLPPLLMSSAYLVDLRDFRRYLPGILSLAVGAVVFTTLAVGAATHWLVPGLPWAACFTLGAVVSPPDAVAARAVLERVRLPRRMGAMLEGESLLNDATGLVLFRFAAAAALTGTFSAGEAAGTFAVLVVGSVAVGWAVGYGAIRALRMQDPLLMITGTLLVPWAAYTAGEWLHLSGVITTVVAGLVFGWFQHEAFDAGVRVQGSGFWSVLVFLLEALVFVLIGLALRGSIERLGGFGPALREVGVPVAGIVGCVVLSRFVWVFASDGLRVLAGRVLAGRVTGWWALERRRFSAGSSAVMAWAGMRGVVTLAIALSLPAWMPGRDLIEAAAFATILVTVLLQGTTLGMLIGWVRLPKEARDEAILSRAQAVALMTAAQLAVIEARARGPDGTMAHPRLLEQFSHRATAAARFSEDEGRFAGDRQAHFDVMLAAIREGRAEVLRLHRAGKIRDDVLRALEHNLDLQQIAAEMARG